MKTVGDYLSFYRIDERVIIVATLWDNWQDPDRLRVD